MNTKTIMWVGIYGVAAYAIYLAIKKLHVTPKEKDILTLYADKFKGFEDAFLKAWADAKKKKIAEFTYNGKVYLSSTGKAKVGASVTSKKSNVPTNPFGDSNIN